MNLTLKSLFLFLTQIYRLILLVNSQPIIGLDTIPKPSFDCSFIYQYLYMPIPDPQRLDNSTAQYVENGDFWLCYSDALNQVTIRREERERRVYELENLISELEWMYDSNSLFIPGQPGPAGPQGPQGNAGQPGHKGSPGTDGSPGINGIQGYTGYPGPTGNTGVLGAVGKTGGTGPAGQKGPTGPPGPSGILGAPGREGVPGSYGDTGWTGVPGQQGDAGPLGPAGPQGV